MTTIRLSEAEIAHAIAILRRSGKTVRWIAVEMGRSRTWVYAHLKLAKSLEIPLRLCRVRL